MKKTSWLKKKEVTAAFAIIGFLGGFLFIDKGGISGNVILESNPSSFNPVSFIGFLLFFCSVILVIYTLRNK